MKKIFVIVLAAVLIVPFSFMHAESYPYEERMLNTANVQEMESIVAELHVKIQAAKSIGDMNQVHYLESMLNAVLKRQNSLTIHHSGLSQENKLLRISARTDSREWKHFWENTANAVGILLLIGIAIPTVAIAWKATFMVWHDRP